VTVVGLSKVQGGWSVAALGSKTIADELNEIMRAVMQYGEPQMITIYLVPNLKAHIYGVKVKESEMYFTNYSSRFNLQKEVRKPELVMALIQDSQRFQKEFGERIKREKLTD
jgi:hypothetical protein